MKEILILLINSLTFLLILGTFGCLIYATIWDKKIRICLFTGVILWLCMFIILPKQIPYYLSRSEIITSGILASVVSMLIPSCLFGWLEPRVTILKTLVLNWSVYSILPILDYLCNQPKVMFSWAETPTYYDIFSSYFMTYFLLDLHNPKYPMLIGIIGVYIVRYIKLRTKSYRVEL